MVCDGIYTKRDREKIVSGLNMVGYIRGKGMDRMYVNNDVGLNSLSVLQAASEAYIRAGGSGLFSYELDKDNVPYMSLNESGVEFLKQIMMPKYNRKEERLSAFFERGDNVIRRTTRHGPEVDIGACVHISDSTPSLLEGNVLGTPDGYKASASRTPDSCFKGPVGNPVFKRVDSFVESPLRRHQK